MLYWFIDIVQVLQRLSSPLVGPVAVAGGKNRIPDGQDDEEQKQ